MSIMHQKIKEKIQEILEEKQTCRDYVSYEESSQIVKRKKEQFALFGTIAYKLNRFNNEDCSMLPVILKGKIWGEFPDEGRSGVLHVYYIKGRRRWGCGFIPCGWLHTEELELTDKEIALNIAKEIIAGENVITTPPPGWI